MDDEEFSLWLHEDSGNKYFGYCRFCKKSFSLSNMGKQALISHNNSKKHYQIVRDGKHSYDINIFNKHPEKEKNTIPSTLTVSSEENLNKKDTTTLLLQYLYNLY